MKSQKGFTLIEMLVVIAIIGILAAMLSGPLMKARRTAQLTQCTNNLKQIGTALMQYEMNYQTAPAFDSTNATLTTADAKQAASNLMRLYSAGINDNLMGFVCPVSNFTPNTTDITANATTVMKEADGTKYTAYNLTTAYGQGDPSNKIVGADMPIQAGNLIGSVHDETDKLNDGPNCLYKDGHVKNEKKLCPEGSSEYDLKSNGNIYTRDNSSVKDTYIPGITR